MGYVIGCEVQGVTEPQVQGFEGGEGEQLPEALCGVGCCCTGAHTELAACKVGHYLREGTGAVLLIWRWMKDEGCVIGVEFAGQGGKGTPLGWGEGGGGGWDAGWSFCCTAHLTPFVHVLSAQDV